MYLLCGDPENPEIQNAEKAMTKEGHVVHVVKTVQEADAWLENRPSNMRLEGIIVETTLKTTENVAERVREALGEELAQKVPIDSVANVIAGLALTRYHSQITPLVFLDLMCFTEADMYPSAEGSVRLRTRRSFPRELRDVFEEFREQLYWGKFKNWVDGCGCDVHAAFFYYG